VVNDLSGDMPHQIEARFRDGFPYHQRSGVYADVISLTEASPPLGWEGRVRTEQIAHDPHDVPDVVSPGSEIEAVFPSGADRGPGFVLEQHVGYCRSKTVSRARSTPHCSSGVK
jgi:hypothetical protein